MYKYAFAFVALGALGTVLAADPVAKGNRFEYGELQLSTTSVRGGKGFPGNINFNGGPAPQRGKNQPAGKAGRANNPQAVQPNNGGWGVPVVRVTGLTWTVGSEEITANTWVDLGDKLKVPAGKPATSENVARIRLLNHLGSQGWELVSSANEVMTFKRAAQK